MRLNIFIVIMKLKVDSLSGIKMLMLNVASLQLAFSLIVVSNSVQRIKVMSALVFSI